MSSNFRVDTRRYFRRFFIQIDVEGFHSTSSDIATLNPSEQGSAGTWEHVKPNKHFLRVNYVTNDSGTSSFERYMPQLACVMSMQSVTLLLPRDGAVFGRIMIRVESLL